MLKLINWKSLFVILLVLHLLPLWIFTYFPSQDGPSHIYNALILKEYHKHENYMMRDVWKLNITIFPNWLSHLMLAALLYVFPPLLAEKVFLTLAVGLVPLSFFYLLDAVHKRGFVFAWLGFLFSYNYLLFMGFYNFALSTSLFFFSFGYWWRHKDDTRVNHLIVLYILILLTYLAHIASYGLLLLGLSLAAGCLWGGAAIATAWHARKEGLMRITTQFWAGLKPLARFGLYMIPVYFVLVDYYLKSLRDSQGGQHIGMEWIKDYFWGVKSIVYFTDWHIRVHHVLLVMLGIGILVSLAYRIARKQWVRRNDVFLVIALVFTYMFISSPRRFGTGGWINDRIHFYILLMLAPWLVADMWKWLRYGFAAALVVISLLHLGRTTYDIARLSPELAEQASGAHLIKPHMTYAMRVRDWHKSDALGSVKYVAPFGHSVAYYGLYADDVGNLGNYEAKHDYFPIDLLHQPSYGGREDYVVAWAYPPEEKFDDLKSDFDLIHETKNLKLFQRKQAEAPDLSIWSDTADGRRVIRFDMQPPDGQTAEDYHAVHKDLAYVSGRFGWKTQSPHNHHGGNPDLPPHHRDSVWDRHDAAFKLDLPNGSYRVTNFFCSAEDKGHQVNLLANGNRMIKKLIVPPGNETVQHTYEIDVTDEHLTQVIFRPNQRVPKAGMHNHWVWNGFTVEQIFQ